MIFSYIGPEIGNSIIVCLPGSINMYMYLRVFLEHIILKLFGKQIVMGREHK